MQLIDSGLISPVRVDDETQVVLSDTSIDLSDGTYTIVLSRNGVGQGTDATPVMARIEVSPFSYQFYVRWSNATEDADMGYVVVRKD